MMTYIIDRDGNALMPTERGNIVRHMLKRGEAKVVRYAPFTVQILREVGHHVQEVTLGVDVGSKHIGLSASTKTKELYSAQVEVRDDVSELLTARREFRRGRRGRMHNWYRPARWQNRANQRNKDLPPSIRHKADSHIRMIEFVCRMLPVWRVRLEIGKFDSQRLANPTIQGEQYQHGVLAGRENLKAYAKWRDGYKCRVCGKGGKDVRLEVHHVRRRADGGSDTPDNVVTLCHECHEKHHQGKGVLKFRRPPVRKNEAHMNAMRKYLYEMANYEFPAQFIVETYGYETAMARRENGIEKSHAADAYCIARNFKAKMADVQYAHKMVRRHNRQLHKATILRGGIRKANQAPREVKGFRLNDRVRYKGKVYFVHGRRVKGSFVLKSINKTGGCEVSPSRLKLVNRTQTILTERRMCNSSQP